MPELLSKIVIPVADREVATATAQAALSYIDDDSEIVLVHVIDEDEYTSEAEWVEFAEEAFDGVREVLGSNQVSSEIRTGSDVANTIFAIAADVDASAILFRSRGGSRWRQILAGDVAREMVTEAEIPVVVLPSTDD